MERLLLCCLVDKQDDLAGRSNTPAAARLYRVAISHSWIQKTHILYYKIYNFCSLLFIFYSSLAYLPHDTIVRQRGVTGKLPLYDNETAFFAYNNYLMLKQIYEK